MSKGNPRARIVLRDLRRALGLHRALPVRMVPTPLRDRRVQIVVWVNTPLEVPRAPIVVQTLSMTSKASRRVRIVMREPIRVPVPLRARTVVQVNTPLLGPHAPIVMQEHITTSKGNPCVRIVMREPLRVPVPHRARTAVLDNTPLRGRRVPTVG